MGIYYILPIAYVVAVLSKKSNCDFDKYTFFKYYPKCLCLNWPVTQQWKMLWQEGMPLESIHQQWWYSEGLQRADRRWSFIPRVFNMVKMYIYWIWIQFFIYFTWRFKTEFSTLYLSAVVFEKTVSSCSKNIAQWPEKWTLKNVGQRVTSVWKYGTSLEKNGSTSWDWFLRVAAVWAKTFLSLAIACNSSGVMSVFPSYYHVSKHNSVDLAPLSCRMIGWKM